MMQDIEWDYVDKPKNLKPYQILRQSADSYRKFKFLKEDLPVLISQQGEIVCIERSADVPNIGVCGMRRTAKTVTSFGLLDRIWHSREDIMMAVLNDGQYESLTHSYKNNVNFMTTKLKFLYERPRGLPLVFLFPSLAKSGGMPYPGSYKVAIPFHDFFEQMHYFKHFGELGASENYVRELAESMKAAKNSAEALLSIDGIGAAASKNKVIAFFKNMFDEKIFDISANEGLEKGEQRSLVKLKIKKKTTDPDKKIKELILDPFLGFMCVGLIPCFITHHLQTKKYGPDIFTYYLRKVFESQDPNGLFGQMNKIICLFVDELEAIQTEENAEILARCVTEGAHRRIMLNWSTQNFSNVNERLRKNTKFLISLRQTRAEANEISSEYDLDISEVQQLRNLKKDRFEAMVMTKEKFKIYNPQTGKISYADEGAIKGTILFPLSRPKAPDQLPSSGITVAKCILKQNNISLFNPRSDERILRLDKKVNPTVLELIGKKTFPVLDSTIDLQKAFFRGVLERNYILTFQELQRMGFVILSIPLNPNDTWFPGQTVMYMIWLEGKLCPRHATILNFVPDSHKIIYDTVNKRIRLWGRNAGLSSVGKWVEIQ